MYARLLLPERYRCIRTRYSSRRSGGLPDSQIRRLGFDDTFAKTVEDIKQSSDDNAENVADILDKVYDISSDICENTIILQSTIDSIAKARSPRLCDLDHSLTTLVDAVCDTRDAVFDTEQFLIHEIEGVKDAVDVATEDVSKKSDELADFVADTLKETSNETLDICGLIVDSVTHRQTEDLKEFIEARIAREFDQLKTFIAQSFEDARIDTEPSCATDGVVVVEDARFDHDSCFVDAIPTEGFVTDLPKTTGWFW